LNSSSTEEGPGLVLAHQPQLALRIRDGLTLAACRQRQVKVKDLGSAGGGLLVGHLAHRRPDPPEPAHRGLRAERPHQFVVALRDVQGEPGRINVTKVPQRRFAQSLLDRSCANELQHCGTQVRSISGFEVWRFQKKYLVLQ
jgi:hypothetical protein